MNRFLYANRNTILGELANYYELSEDMAFKMHRRLWPSRMLLRIQAANFAHH